MVNRAQTEDCTLPFVPTLTHSSVTFGFGFLTCTNSLLLAKAAVTKVLGATSFCLCTPSTNQGAKYMTGAYN